MTPQEEWSQDIWFILEQFEPESRGNEIAMARAQASLQDRARLLCEYYLGEDPDDNEAAKCQQALDEQPIGWVVVRAAAKALSSRLVRKDGDLISHWKKAKRRQRDRQSASRNTS